ncbi:MAG: hypothetical protein LBC17_04670 [Lactobacillaceae bacterium]|jgi:competence protein ComGC|nr:hypothetical protein [Lactobacillaceae bacterium]
MELKLLSKKSFSMIEIMVVLLVISSISIVTLQKRENNQDFILDRTVKEYESFYDSIKMKNFLSDQDTYIRFSNSKIECDGRTLILNKNIKFQTKEIILHSNGYVAPTSVEIYDLNNKIIGRLIYSLGFGVFRFEKN